MKFLFNITREYKLSLVIVMVAKISILLILGFVSMNFPNSRTTNLNIWDIWNVWDAPHYIWLASEGYSTVGDEANFLVLLPFFSITIFIFKHIFLTDYLIAAYLVSAVATIFMAIVFYRLILLDHPKKTAFFAIFFLFIFPTSFFLHIPYTEALFLLLVIASFYFIRTRKYFWGFLFAGLATFTKVAGLALIPALFAEILIYDKGFFRVKKLSDKLIFLAVGFLLSISGYLFYLLLNYYLWGDFFYFVKIQREHFFEVFSPLGLGLMNVVKSLNGPVRTELFMLGYAQIIAFSLALILSLYTLVKIRISYGIFALSVLFFSYSMSFWICMPRYILVIFPMYLALALIAKNILVRFFWTLFSLAALITLSLIFVQYGPVF